MHLQLRSPHLTDCHSATMCHYWKKQHTCGHPSDRPYVEMCRPGIVSNTICSDIGWADPRKSHFPCWTCIKGEAREEAAATRRDQDQAVTKAHHLRDIALREKQAAEQRAKEERIRREAREKAAREREDEARAREWREREEECAKKEGGAWIETGSVKKMKGRKSLFAGPPVVMPLSAAPPVLNTLVTKDRVENENGGNKMSPKREGKGLEMGGRAGTWGPPKKILSRKENLGMKK